MQENVPVKYKCGHVVNVQMPKDHATVHGKRFVCEECRRKELGC